MNETMINLLVNFFSSIEPDAFSLENYLFLHFTILGIVVTLVALTTTLTKEVRQDLIWDYYLKTKFVISYYFFIIFSFVATLLVYMSNNLKLSGFVFVLSTILFLYTTIFIPCFMWRLKRGWLYKKILKEFKNEIKKEKQNY